MIHLEFVNRNPNPFGDSLRTLSHFCCIYMFRCEDQFRLVVVQKVYARSLPVDSVIHLVRWSLGVCAYPIHQPFLLFFAPLFSASLFWSLIFFTFIIYRLLWVKERVSPLTSLRYVLLIFVSRNIRDSEAPVQLLMSCTGGGNRLCHIPSDVVVLHHLSAVTLGESQGFLRTRR